MSKFTFPTRYDAATAEEGVWMSVEDEHGNLYGEFKLKLVDKLSDEYQLLTKRIRARFAKELKNATMLDEARLVLVEGALLDWKLAGSNSKVPFSKKDAHEYFAMEEARIPLIQCHDFAINVTNFAPELVEEAEAAEKN